MTESEIYAAVKKWIEDIAAQGEFSGVTAWKEFVARPRPTSTTSGSKCPIPETGLYVTMDISADDIVQECGPEIVRDECGVCFSETQCCLNEVTIDLQSYRCGALDLMKCLRASLKLHTIRKACFPDMSVRDIGVITPISQIIKGSREERAAMSVTFGYVSTVTAPVECLELDCDPCFDPCADPEPLPEIIYKPVTLEECH